MSEQSTAPAGQVFSHFVEFRSTGGVNRSPHPTGQFRLAAAVVDQVHFENVRRDGAGLPRLAVGFPSMMEGGHDTMARIRVFGGDPVSLDAFATRAAEVLGVEGDRNVAVLPAKAVPATADFAVFRRDRSAERGHPGFAERSLARAQRKAMERAARGEAVQKPPLGIAERLTACVSRQTPGDYACRAFLRLESRSTQNGFSLFIAAQSADCGPSGAIDIYGLSRAEAPTAVPHF